MAAIEPSGARLPVAEGPDGPARERADAARNRRLILEAADRLIAERGAAGISMDAIAREACVGKGTLFRRFGDRAGLALALLDERERDFQDDLIRGAPPLGPGAPPAERLVAFGHAMLELLERNGDILLLAETGSAPGARFRSAPHATHRAHVALLLREADPSLDADLLAEMLLASLASELFLHLRTGGEVELDRLRDGWSALVRRVLDVPGRRPVARARGNGARR